MVMFRVYSLHPTRRALQKMFVGRLLASRS